MENNKPQHLTSLNNDVMVRKDHPMIHFRGLLDGVMADVAYGAALAYKDGNAKLVAELEDFNKCLMEIMSAHYRGRKPNLPTIDGRDMELLHEMSHNPQKYFKCGHFVPSAREGLALAWLNVIRTKVRDAERAFIAACGDELDEPLCLALNRVSSAAYVMMCEWHQAYVTEQDNMAKNKKHSLSIDVRIGRKYAFKARKRC